MSETTIADLKPSQRGWSIKVTTIRRFTIQEFKNRKGEPLRIQKFIIVDKMGEGIQVTLFNELIEKFSMKLIKGKTCLIIDGSIKPIDRRYQNVNNRIEISLFQSSEVEEIEDEVYNLKESHLVNFESLTNEENIESQMDIMGGVIQVKSMVIRKYHTNYTKKREVLIMDNKSNILTLTLWDDLAESEGQFLEDNCKERNIIQITNIKRNIFEGEILISSTNSSVISINPSNEKADALKARLDSISRDRQLRDLSYPSKKMLEAKEVNLDDIMKGKVENPYCSFIGRILRI